MRITLLLIVLGLNTWCYAQPDDRITTMEFVQVLNGHNEEALYYYQNNWKLLRDMAVKNGYIHSFHLLEAPPSEDQPWQFILITTYTDKAQYDLREDHFTELIQQRGKLKLLNEKKPAEFRKTLFSKDLVRHWN